MTDTTLQAMSKVLDKKLVDPLRMVLQARTLVPITPPAGMGKSSVEWDTLTDMSDGLVSYAFTDGNEDELGYSHSTQKIPFYWKDFKIDRGAYEAFKSEGRSLDAANALAAGYKAAKVEDAAIINGVLNVDGSTYDINGLYQGAGNDYTTASTMSTAGVPTTAVAGAMNLMEQDDIPVNIPMNLVLHPTQANKLRPLRSTNGIREMPEVLEMLNGGKIISTTALTAGTGMLLPVAEVAEPFFDYFLRVDWRTELGKDSKHPDTGPINGRVYSGGTLRIKRSAAICKLSNLT